MSLRSFACQLAVRLGLIAMLLISAGSVSYTATHWEPPTSGAETAVPAH